MGELASRSPAGGLLRYARSFYLLLGNRRKFERVPWTGTVLLTTKGVVLDTTEVCSCVDISRRGIAVDCPSPLPVGGFVQVHADEYGPRRMARIRHCAARGEQHRVGLEFIAEPQ